MSDVKALEHPTLKVPYEVLNKKFRSAQKQIDREVSHVQSATNELEKTLQKRSSTVGEIRALLGGMVEKLNLLKRKADESVVEELEAASVCKRRVEHLKEHSSLINQGSSSAWKKKRLDRMLVEHFLRCGYYNTALKLAKHAQIEDLTNIELFAISKEVEESLLHKDTSKCLNWCYDNKSKLRKLKSSLEFNLRQQEFIELVRNDRRMDAVKHSRKYFVNLEEDQLKEVQHAMGLLAYPVTTTISPYKELLDECRWNMLVQQFRQENFKLFQLNNFSVFSVVLQAGLSALKTPQCYKPEFERNPDCPVCSPTLNALAQNLPYAHCSQSRLVCAISGQALNEHNHPMVLPNGHVYGEEALKRMVLHTGKIICPRTKMHFEFKDAEKVFVM